MKQQSLRPNNLREFIGKNSIKKNLMTYIKAAQLNHKQLDHCLFCGLPGTGKTTLAMIIAKNFNSNLKIVQGSIFQKNIDVYNCILNIKENDILFIDEIHAINQSCYELFYNLMEDFSFDIVIGKDFNTKITRIKIPHFTLIGATTSLSNLPAPFEQRFGIVFYFDSYKTDEIVKIVENCCKKLNLTLKLDDIHLIANNSKGIPRIALMILLRVNDYKIVNPKSSVAKILEEIGIFKGGLNQNDMKYLKAFVNNQKFLGIKTISQITQFDQKFIESKIEPYLIQIKYLVKTNNGRMLSNLAWNFLHKYHND